MGKAPFMDLAAASDLFLEGLQEAGITQLPQSPSTLPLPGGGCLEALAKEVAACRACALCESRTQTVFGSGNANPSLVFIGEAPGFEEDRQGLPFVGPAGKLLTAIIEKGFQVPRAEVYIANTLKCRPPENRDPTDEEKSSCLPFLERQLAALKPSLVIALGLHAAQQVVGQKLSLSRLRGKVHTTAGGLSVVCTYHPAYLLRKPEAKPDCWKDIQLAMNFLQMDSRGNR